MTMQYPVASTLNFLCRVAAVFVAAAAYRDFAGHQIGEGLFKCAYLLILLTTDFIGWARYGQQNIFRRMQAASEKPILLLSVLAPLFLFVAGVVVFLFEHS